MESGARAEKLAVENEEDKCSQNENGKDLYAKSDEENIGVFKKHLEKLFGREAKVDESVLDEIPQQPIHERHGDVPTVDEIDAAVRKLNYTAAGFTKISPQMWKAIARDNELFFDWLVQYVVEFWTTGRVPDGWEVMDCVMLPKKGDLSLPSNWRSIMKIEIPQKVVLNIMQSRLVEISETLDHEAQCGFRPMRGCIDAIFNV